MKREIMNYDNDKKYFKVSKSILLVVVLILAAGLAGWFLGRDTSPADDLPSNDDQSNETDVSGTGVKSLITYNLPDGWKEAGCDAAPSAVFIIPAGAPALDCEGNPSSPVKISVDPGSTKDCNELQNITNVKKHVCISLYINNHRSLKASTEYLAASSYGKATTINAYYIDIGSEVIRVEYTFHSDNQYEAGFDQLANSIK